MKRRRNPDLSPDIERWLPHGSYRNGRWKSHKSNDTLMWIWGGKKPLFWRVSHEPDGSWELWTGRPMHSDDGSELGPWYVDFTEASVRFIIDPERGPVLSDDDLRALGVAGYQILLAMLPRFAEHARAEPYHRIGPMPRKRRSW